MGKRIFKVSYIQVFLCDVKMETDESFCNGKLLLSSAAIISSKGYVF